jgi:putative phage-type endonuclease
MIYACEQRSEAWSALRVGKVTGSRTAEVCAEIKKGEAASRRNYRAEIIAETLTGQPADTYISKEMQWGIDTEPFARAAYELECDATVDSGIGFAVHPRIKRFGASPDGLVGNDGLVELKCPNTATHIDYILSGIVPAEYKAQMLSEMACSERQWCDFVSFDPRLPRRLQLFVRRFARDDARILEIETKVEQFLAEVDDVILRLESSIPVESDSLLTQLQDSLSMVLDRKNRDEVVM